jgi:hypothetical protein
VQLFLVAFQQPIPFGISAILVITMIYIILRVGDDRRGRSTLGPQDHEPEREVPVHVPVHRVGVVFGIGLQLVPHTGANSPYGGIGLIALFSGFFIMMGFLWAVIGEYARIPQ